VRKLSVLVIGDNPDTHQILENVKDSNGGWSVLEFTDCLDRGLDMLNSDSYEAIVVDAEFVDEPGLKSVRKIVSAAPESAIIVLSEPDNADSHADASVHFGAQDYIEKKNLSPLQLSKSIVYAVDRKNWQMEKKELITNIVDALKMVEKLQHLLPLCVSCKKFYNQADQSWLDIDAHLLKAGRTNAPLICPDCRDVLKNRQC